ETLAEVTITGTTGGNFESISTTGAVNNTVIDDGDTTTISVNQVDEEGTVVTDDVVEGNSITFRFSVDNVPTSNVVLQTSLGEVTIEAGKQFVDVLVDSRADDKYIQGEGTVLAEVTDAVGGGFENLSYAGASSSATIVDDTDATTVTLDSVTNNQQIEEGGSIVYSVSVDSPVTESSLFVTLSNGVVIEIPVGDSTADSDPVAVRADDDQAQGEETLAEVTITGTTGGNFESISTTGAVNNTVID
ncbi:immunoglobulin-like domain-containing protein, partial [uncultured Neptuniibacter sp.]|uniref:immunoglobulin-like domain-containing protein n=1 Tax=uncultured Neptuniibacter sp. TaxID=502143 RepID=UPI00262AE2F9